MPPKKGSRVEKFRKAVWRDCFQAHWDDAHEGILMPADTATALRLAQDEAGWCGVLAAGGKVTTAKRKRAAAVSQAEAEQETSEERGAPMEGMAAAAAAGAGGAAAAAARG